MKVIVTTRHGGAERHVVVEGPPGVSVEEVLSTVGARAAHAPGPRPARPVLHGDDLAVGRAREAAGAPPWIVAADGPDAGMVTSLPPGRWVSIGRDPACDLTVGDPSLSRLHVRVRLERSGVRVQDMGSTNGVAWESGAEGDVWAADDRLLLGSTSLALVTRPPAPARTTVADGRVEIVPWPREPRTIEEVRLHRPPHPERRRVRRPSIWSWGLPLAVAVAVALMLRMPWLLMFGLLGPAMVLGQHLAERRAAREEFEEACQDHRVRTRAVEETARSALAAELRARRDADGGLTGVAGALVCGDPASSTVWACLEEEPSLVVGTGAVASGVSLDGEVLRHACAPVVVPLDAPLAVAGPRPLRDGVMRSLLLQLASRHPPDQVTVSVDPGRFGDPGDDLGALLAWLPHTVTVSAAAAPGPTSPVRRTIGWGHDLLLVEDPAALPAGATLVVVHSATHAAVHGPDGRVRTCAPTLLGPSAARSMVRRLAALRLASGHDAPATREEGLDSPDLLRWPADVDDVLAGWTRPGLDVVLGVDPGGAPVRIDLVRDGPHALVAGTTGSGKSELLRTLVAGLALRCSPADLALLLIDYKGGSSLGDCARLPHVTGLVTDLDPHLAERVLVSLQAELTRRESVLRSAGARDVREYSGGDLPRLVVVIDEFRVLAEEVPEVLTRLVRLAAVGRSLGVHLILATQRPAGVVSADLRANVNLRIALRVRDVADSHDVLDCGDAAALPEGRPGLALVRTGPETPRQVQVTRLTARPATPTDPEQAAPLRVRGHRDIWSARADLESAPETAGEDAIGELVALTQGAATRDALRPPVVWLPPLPDQLDHAQASGAAWVVLDRPAEQRQQELVWPVTHHLGVVGSARSGRSTALRSVLSRLQDCWTVVLDLGQGLDDEALRRSSACCAWVGPDEAAHGLRVLDLLEDLVRRRQTGQEDRPAPVVVAIDGWDRLVEQYGEVERGRGVDKALRLLREGPAVGVVAVVSGDRSLLVGRLAALLPETWALPLNDPSDLLLTGLRSAQVPRDRPPGRVVGVRDGIVGQVVLPEPGRGPRPPAGIKPPLRCVALPPRVGPDAGPGSDDVVWAVGGDVAEPVTPPDGSVLMLGPPGSGRSWTLQVLASLRQGATLRVDGLDPPDVDDLRERLKDPACLSTVVVDDAHLLAGTAVEDLLLDHATSTGADLLVAADLESAAGSFRGLVPATARARCAVLLQPEAPAQGGVVGVQLPVGDLRVPGRGVLVRRGRCTRVQVVSPPAAP